MSLITKPQSQRTNPNASDPLGFPKSGQTIASHGCTITCIAMLSGLTPGEVNKRMQAVNGFVESSVIWNKIPKAIPWLSFPDMGRHYSYDNDIVKAAIARNGGCLVEVDFDGNNARTDDKHWVLYVGNGQMYDPWTGTQRPTGAYPIVTGFAILDVIGKPQGENMADTVPVAKATFEELVTKSTKFDAFVKAGYDTVEKVTTAIKNVLQDNANISEEKKKVEQKLKDVRAEVRNELKPQLSELQDIKAAVEEWSGTKVNSDEDVLEALQAFRLKAQQQLEETQAALKAADAPKTAAIETGREVLRWVIFVGVPLLIQELLNNLAGMSLPPQTAFIVGVVLRAVDKAIHQYGKDTGATVLGYELKKGLTLGV